MKYIVMLKDAPNTSGFSLDEIFKKFRAVEALLDEIREKFPEVKVDENGYLGAIIECSESIANEIEKEFEYVIVRGYAPMGIFDFD